MSTIVSEIIDAFSEAGFMDEAARLKGLADKLDSPIDDEVIVAAKDIIAWCHPKAWGSMGVAGSSTHFPDAHAWWGALERLEKYAKKRVKRKR